MNHRTSPSSRYRNTVLLGAYHCGYRMSVCYDPGSAKKPAYWCDTRYFDSMERQRSCAGLKAPPLDELVAQQVLRALEPAALELSLHALRNIQAERDRLHGHWKQRLERSQYEVQRAERQFDSVEPDNRLVARTLEQKWEEALRQQRQLQEEYDRFLTSVPANVSTDDIERIRASASDIRAIWNAPEMLPQDRKDVIRCLIDHAVVRVEQRSEYVSVTLHWHGGYASEHQIIRPVFCYEQLRDYDQLAARIKELHQEGHSVPQIAKRLNDEGFAPPRRRGVFSVGNVAPLLERLGLISEKYRNDFVGQDKWRIRDLAAKLDVRPGKVHYWVTQGWVNYRKTASDKYWIVWADEEEIKRLNELKRQRYSYVAKRHPKLVTPKARPK